MTPQPQARTRRTRGQQGFTLVELIMATMVFAIGMVAVLGSIVAIMNNHRITATKHEAYVELQNLVPQVRFQLLADPLRYTPPPIEQTGLAPGSQLNLYVVRPADSTLFGPLPLSEQEITDAFGGTAPDPLEIVFEALVPMSLAPDENDRVFMQFRVAALY